MIDRPASQAPAGAPPVPAARFATPLNKDVPVAAPGEFAPLQLGEGQVRGVVPVWPPVVLAPMAGVTNLAFRSMCREYGAVLEP